MRISSVHCFKYLLFVVIAFVLPGIAPQVNGITKSASPPLILYTDITSGPNSGGEGDNGTYLTIFGTHFGATRGASKVTINGQSVAQYLLWSDRKIGVQVGHVSSGPIVVSVGGLASNKDKMFTVRSGRIRYIGPSVENSPASCAGGTYEKPWGLTNMVSNVESASMAKMRTPYSYYKCVSPGDTLVFLDGVSYSCFDGRGWRASLTPDANEGDATHFVTFMARPGASVQLGGTGCAKFSVRDISKGYNVFSGLKLTGSGSSGGAQFAPNDRVVGNEITCPDCSGPSGAVGGGDGLILYGNDIHDIATLEPGGSVKLYHAVYVMGNNIEIAWNKIHNTKAYNGIQINHDGSPGFYNQSWHDNDIGDVNGSGINLSTIDPSKGYIRVFNNVIHHVGLNIADSGSPDDPHSCIAVKGYGRSTDPGTVEIYNNTMVDCSSYLNINSSNRASCAVIAPGRQLNVKITFVNNIVYQPAYAGTAKQDVYICGGDPFGTFSGSNNLWYSESRPGNSAAAIRYGTIANPRFVSPTNYHLKTGSPAIGAGIPFGGLTSDFDAKPRATLPGIGAYE